MCAKLTLSYKDSVVLDPVKLFFVKLTLSSEDSIILDLVKSFLFVKLILPFSYGKVSVAKKQIYRVIFTR